METSNEKYFDDQIRKKLSDVEAAAISWDEFAATNQADLFVGKSLRRFLFSDLILLLCLSSYLLLNEYGFSNHLDGSKTIFNKSTEISKSNEGDISIMKSQKSTTNFSNQTEENSGSVSDNNIANESNNNDNQNLNSKDNYSTSNGDVISNIGNSIQSNNNLLASSKNEVKSNSNKKKRKQFTYSDNSNYVTIIENNDLDFLNAKDFILFPSNDSSSIDQLNKISIDQTISNPGLFPISIEVYGIFNHDISKVSKSSENFQVEFPKQKYFSNNGIGVGFRYLLGKKFALQTGFEYLTSNYNLNYSINSSQSGWMVDSITGYIIYPFDPPVPFTVYDSTLSVFSVKKNFEVSVEEKSIVVPVYLVYRIRKNNWSVESVTGASINVNSSVSINSTKIANDESSEFNSYLPKYSNEIRFSFYFGLSLARQVSNHFEIFTQPSIQINLNDATSNESFTAIRNRYTGLKLGLRYQFTKK